MGTVVPLETRRTAQAAPREAAPARPIAGWGRWPVEGIERFGESLERLTEPLDVSLSRGLGRSYGDSSLPERGGVVANTTLADRMLGFDARTGVLRAEAGLSLADINRVFLPRSWFVPVSPGTQFVTLGGMVAADVHGKNHHVEGTFGRHVRALRMRVADGRVIEVDRATHPDLFAATLGGMGLTGHILEVEFTMRRVGAPWIVAETQRMPDIDAFMAGLAEAAAGWPCTMGWIDCISGGRRLGRGILYRGRWAESHEAPGPFPGPKRRITFPMDLPTFTLNRITVQAFNALNYGKHGPGVRRRVEHPEQFWYPLDAIRGWNRLYGRAGFTQYQCVLPKDGGARVAREFLQRLTALGGASFLCVIKDCGEEGEGLLSFPMPGISIALDIPIRSGTQQLVDRLNEHVIACGGRIYLAKDTFTRPEHFRAMERRLERFQEVRRHWDPELRLRSHQSVRLFGDPPVEGTP